MIWSVLWKRGEEKRQGVVKSRIVARGGSGRVVVIKKHGVGLEWGGGMRGKREKVSVMVFCGS